ncbi:TPA: type 1 fimbrial protein, partial [Escherichia coli O25b:H4-ST131]|nr:type 1 fimbrial protein [Escherichia coli O25b:H4-ST131]
MIKSVIAGAVAMAVVSFGVNAALTTPQGQGSGQLSKSFLQAGGVSKPMNLDIELVNCDITSFKGGEES